MVLSIVFFLSILDIQCKFLIGNQKYFLEFMPLKKSRNFLPIKSVIKIILWYARIQPTLSLATSLSTRRLVWSKYSKSRPKPKNFSLGSWIISKAKSERETKLSFFFSLLVLSFSYDWAESLYGNRKMSDLKIILYINWISNEFFFRLKLFLILFFTKKKWFISVIQIWFRGGGWISYVMCAAEYLPEPVLFIIFLL